jgi:L-ascorbate metabolism protein UlaG (beta-lactamase superfamily)
MKITKFEQSGFIFETEKGFRLAVDIGSYTPVEKLEGVKADAMIVSHLHSDHLSPEQIRKLSPKKLYINSECIETLGEEKLTSEIVTIKSGTDISIGEIEVKIFEVDHGPNVRTKPKENFGFLFKIDGQTIYHSGDIFYPSGLDVAELEVDYALLPVGTFYTFGPEEAIAFAKTFKRIGKAIPIHDRKMPETTAKFLELAKGHFATETF